MTHIFTYIIILILIQNMFYAKGGYEKKGQVKNTLSVTGTEQYTLKYRCIKTKWTMPKYFSFLFNLQK